MPHTVYYPSTCDSPSSLTPTPSKPPWTSTSVSLVFLLVVVWWPVRRCCWEGRETTKSAQIKSDPLTHTHTLAQAQRCADQWAVKRPSVGVPPHLHQISQPWPRIHQTCHPTSECVYVCVRVLLLTTSVITVVLAAQVDTVCVTWWLLALWALLPRSLTVRPNIWGGEEECMEGWRERQRLEKKVTDCVCTFFILCSWYQRTLQVFILHFISVTADL